MQYFGDQKDVFFFFLLFACLMGNFMRFLDRYWKDFLLLLGAISWNFLQSDVFSSRFLKQKLHIQDLCRVSCQMYIYPNSPVVVFFKRFFGFSIS